MLANVVFQNIRTIENLDEVDVNVQATTKTQSTETQVPKSGEAQAPKLAMSENLGRQANKPLSIKQIRQNFQSTSGEVMDLHTPHAPPALAGSSVQSNDVQPESAQLVPALVGGTQPGYAASVSHPEPPSPKLVDLSDDYLDCILDGEGAQTPDQTNQHSEVQPITVEVSEDQEYPACQNLLDAFEKEMSKPEILETGPSEVPLEAKETAIITEATNQKATGTKKRELENEMSEFLIFETTGTEAVKPTTNQSQDLGLLEDPPKRQRLDSGDSGKFGDSGFVSPSGSSPILSNGSSNQRSISPAGHETTIFSGPREVPPLTNETAIISEVQRFNGMEKSTAPVPIPGPLHAPLIPSQLPTQVPPKLPLDQNTVIIHECSICKVTFKQKWRLEKHNDWSHNVESQNLVPPPQGPNMAPQDIAPRGPQQMAPQQMVHQQHMARQQQMTRQQQMVHQQHVTHQQHINHQQAMAHQQQIAHQQQRAHQQQQIARQQHIAQQRHMAQQQMAYQQMAPFFVRHDRSINRSLNNDQCRICTNKSSLCFKCFRAINPFRMS